MRRREFVSLLGAGCGVADGGEGAAASGACGGPAH